eukprot:CAMPEP_0184311462 /NCGR_PEP_ID=MMETSP1049-20130417/41917_1 /TAXON_ID=77928 /ORGANISM="Proteomonas sulcata, Strain CCMP704" /LENGTH=33 /DNA_ID= /DNA_START= /DNA_END= /DNA_ORIENTATION=
MKTNSKTLSLSESSALNPQLRRFRITGSELLRV